jgi:AraC family transcriptional regulator
LLIQDTGRNLVRSLYFLSIRVIVRQFPDLQWLKTRTGQIPAKGSTVPLRVAGWPTLVMNATTRSVVRPDIRGSLTLFTNFSGESFAEAAGHRVRVNEQFYFISNQDEHYSLQIDSPRPVETFNVHFGQAFTEGFYGSVALPAGKLLDADPADRRQPPLAFFNKLYPRSDAFNALVVQIRQSHRSGTDALLLDEQLSGLLTHLLFGHRQLEKDISRLPPVRQATRTEIYRRLSRSADYLHSFYNQNITLDELAGVACMSKFHFLRLFKIAFATTPHQYLLRIRLGKACDLLRRGQLPVHDLAASLGFEDASSFSRAFFRAYRVYPTAFRNGCR